jgi:DNA-binding XRE family transcriptional regulator
MFEKITAEQKVNQLLEELGLTQAQTQQLILKILERSELGLTQERLAEELLKTLEVIKAEAKHTLQ